MTILYAFAAGASETIVFMLQAPSDKFEALHESVFVNVLEGYEAGEPLMTGSPAPLDISLAEVVVFLT